MSQSFSDTIASPCSFHPLPFQSGQSVVLSWENGGRKRDCCESDLSILELKRVVNLRWIPVKLGVASHMSHCKSSYFRKRFIAEDTWHFAWGVILASPSCSNASLKATILASSKRVDGNPNVTCMPASFWLCHKKNKTRICKTSGSSFKWPLAPQSLHPCPTVADEHPGASQQQISRSPSPNPICSSLAGCPCDLMFVQHHFYWKCFIDGRSNFFRFPPALAYRSGSSHPEEPKRNIAATQLTPRCFGPLQAESHNQPKY